MYVCAFHVWCAFAWFTCVVCVFRLRVSVRVRRVCSCSCYDVLHFVFRVARLCWLLCVLLSFYMITDSTNYCARRTHRPCLAPRRRADRSGRVPEVTADACCSNRDLEELKAAECGEGCAPRTGHHWDDARICYASHRMHHFGRHLDVFLFRRFPRCSTHVGVFHIFRLVVPLFSARSDLYT